MPNAVHVLHTMSCTEEQDHQAFQLKIFHYIEAYHMQGSSDWVRQGLAKQLAWKLSTMTAFKYLWLQA